MNTSDQPADAWLSFGLAFIGGYGDAASFVLAKTFTGHVTGNLVLGAIAVPTQDWRAMLGPLSAIVTFLLGVVLSVLIARPLKVWPSWLLLPTIMGIEVILIVGAALVLTSGMARRVEIDFCVSGTRAAKWSFSSCRWHQRSHDLSHGDDYQPNLLGG